MVVDKLNLHPGIINFVAADEPLIFLRVEVLKARWSLHVHCRNHEVRHRVEIMTLEDCLHLSGLVEIQNSEENFALRLEISIDATLLNKRVHCLREFRLNDLTMNAICLDVENKDHIVGPGILHDILHVILWAKLNDIITGLRLQFLHLPQLLLPQLLNLQLLILLLLRHLHLRFLLASEGVDCEARVLEPLELEDE